jgi:hypothetical protein
MTEPAISALPATENSMTYPFTGKGKRRLLASTYDPIELDWTKLASQIDFKTFLESLLVSVLAVRNARLAYYRRRASDGRWSIWCARL